jgi:outer membrane protein OmpA-like peptidoglycan-associated protein
VRKDLVRALSLAFPIAAIGLAACAAKPAPQVQPPAAPKRPVDVVVLLADQDGSVGAADVSNPVGGTALDEAREATTIARGEAPGPAETLSEADVQQMFGDALDALPPAPQRFSLYFRFESEELTAESRAAIPRILESVKRHPAPEVLVVGHTDTTGTRERNLTLGLRRANTVREILVASDLDRSAIEVTSHGESDPLVKTADEVFEARNRRVDITVR